MDTQAREYETFFDQRPSHPARPDWLVRAETKAHKLWAERDRAIDARAEYQRDVDWYDDLARLTAEAQAAQDYADKLARLFVNDEEPAEITQIMELQDAIDCFTAQIAEIDRETLPGCLTPWQTERIWRLQSSIEAAQAEIRKLNAQMEA